MVRSHEVLFVLTVVLAVATHAIQLEDASTHGIGHRVRRQDDVTTTKAPPKRRPTNIFSLFSVLLSETRDDTRRAFGEISKLFNSQFTNTPRPTTPNGPITNGTTPSGAENGDDVSTTTEPYRITREEFNGIVRNNFRGIFNLFGREFSNAIRDSGKNVRKFGRDFREQLRPYVT